METQIEYMKRRLKEFRIMKPEITLPLQRDYPNCGKYTHCCDENWDGKLERIIKMPIKVDYTIHTERDNMKAPKGFKGW